MRLSIIKQIIKDTNMMIIYFSFKHSQPTILGIVKEFVRLLQGLFLIYIKKSIYTTIDDINITKFKSHDEKQRN